jgi:esterase/lipase
MSLITAHWPSDLMAAYQSLIKKIDKRKGVSVVASGCSGAYAVTLADKIQLNSMVMLTPKMSYSDKERYKNLIDIPNYFITSSSHQESYETAQELFSWNGSKGSKLQIFKGNDHNYQLISHKNNLVNDIALWIKFNLR